MTEMRAGTTRPVLVAGAMLLWAAVMAVTASGGQEPPATPRGAPGAATAAPTAVVSLLGRWELNGWACEPIQSTHEIDQTPPRGRSILSGPSQEEMRRVSRPRPVLMIVRQEAHYAVTDDEGHVVRLRPDGVKAKQAWPALDRTTRWDGAALVTEARLSTGARVTQSYTTEDGGLRLVVATRIEGGHARQPLTYKWVYELAAQ